MPRRGITDPLRARTSWLALLVTIGACAWPLGTVARPAPGETAPSGEGPSGAHGPQHAGLAAPPPPLLSAATTPAVVLAGDADRATVRVPRRVAPVVPASAAAAASWPVRRTRAQTWFSRRNLEGG